jgi:hypothetical protein
VSPNFDYILQLSGKLNSVGQIHVWFKWKFGLQLISLSRVLLDKLIVKTARQEILLLLWNLKIHDRVRKSSPLVPIIRQMNPVHNIPPYCPRSVLILSSHLHLGLPSGLFPSVFQAKMLYIFLMSSMCATCSTHLILLDLITLITFGEEWKLWSFSLYSLHQVPVTFSLLGPNLLLSTLSSKHPKST